MSVEIAGVGLAGPALGDERSLPEIVLEGVTEALADAGIGFHDVDAVVTASVDLLDGLTASSIAVTEVIGAVMRPETRIAADGLLAAIHGACLVSGGAYGTVLVVAHCKASLAPYWELTRWALDPVHLQGLGVDFLVCAGLQASALAAGDEDATARWARVVSRRREAASGHGVAEPCSPDDVLTSPVLASPLREQMCAPLADGACAVVLRAADPEERASVVLTSAGFDLDAHGPGDRDLREWAGLRRAWERALGGSARPAPPLALVEPSCLFPHEEELVQRALELDDAVSLSPSGGLFAGAIPVAAGLTRLAAAVRQLRERGEGAAVAHGTWGPAGQGQALALLEVAT